MNMCGKDKPRMCVGVTAHSARLIALMESPDTGVGGEMSFSLEVTEVEEEGRLHVRAETTTESNNAYWAPHHERVAATSKIVAKPLMNYLGSILAPSSTHRLRKQYPLEEISLSPKLQTASLNMDAALLSGLLALASAPDATHAGFLRSCLGG
ncbi:hypothetical protein EYF80_015358 [Liparis tanakae]|uniref:Uncharacterized protein n=1 Tax=Liparis tanakae TaxID=230148 RepID=A0A4Z2I8L3_9TELE|nr:hypothetical protein EYF80_015358 [Liparis tanakae]